MTDSAVRIAARTQIFLLYFSLTYSTCGLVVQRLGLVIKRLRVRYGRRKQIATVVLQLELFTYCCLMFPITCIALVLRLGQSTPYRRSACIDMDMLRLVAAACCDMG